LQPKNFASVFGTNFRFKFLFGGLQLAAAENTSLQGWGLNSSLADCNKPIPEDEEKIREV
jgi:hypothetical protein